MKILFILMILAMPLSYASFAQQYSCDYKVEVLVNGTEFEKENFKWKMRATKIEGASTNITGTAEISDSKGNIIKKYKSWTNEAISKQKTSSEYSPNLKEGEEYLLKAEINVECGDANKNNNVDNKVIRIKQLGTDEILLTKEMRAKENIDNEKNEVNNSITNASIQNSDTKNSDTKEEVKGEDNVISLKKENPKNPLTSDAVQSKIAYESSNEKAKNLIIFFILGISVILNIVLIWRR